MGDDHHIASNDLSAQDAFTGSLLRVEHFGWTFKMVERSINACRFHDTAVLRDVSEEHSQSAIFRVGMGKVVNATLSAVGVERFPFCVLCAHLCAEASCRSTVVNAVGFGVNFVARDVIFLDILSQCLSVDADGREVQQVPLGQFSQNAHNATGAVAFLDGEALRVWRELTQTGHLAAQRVDVGHFEINASFVGHGQKVEHRIGGTAHRDVERHGVEESLARGDATGQHTFVAVFIIFISVSDNQFGSVFKEAPAVGVRGKDCAVARQ